MGETDAFKAIQADALLESYREELISYAHLRQELRNLGFSKEEAEEFIYG